MKRFAAFAALLAAFAVAGAQEDPSGEELAVAALAKFDQKLPTLSPEIRGDAEFLRGLIRDYYTKRNEISKSESEIAETVLGEVGALPIGRGNYADLYGKLRKESEASSPSGKGQAKPSRIETRPTFQAGASSAAGGKEIGYVVLSVAGRKRRIVEVPGIKGLSPAARAEKIAARLTRTAKADPLWWMKLRSAQSGGETVLRVPGSSLPFLITADKPFAHEWGTSPSDLADRIKRKIRTTFDTMAGDGIEFRGVLDPGDDERDAAITLRQDGDDVVKDHADEAASKYREAIEMDRTYLVAYIRLIALYRQQGDALKARTVFDEASKLPNLASDDREELNRAMKEAG